MSYQDTYEAVAEQPGPLRRRRRRSCESIRRRREGDRSPASSSQLSFGTAGLRGTMGVGLHRMNVHVIRHATQAFAQVILEEGAQAAAPGRGHLL